MGEVKANRQMVDDLKLQAWLAGAEWRNPSLRDDVSALAQLRDDLRVQVELGKMQAKDHWSDLEGTWGKLKNELDRSREDVGDDVKILLADLKKGYRRLTDRV